MKSVIFSLFILFCSKVDGSVGNVTSEAETRILPTSTFDPEVTSAATTKLTLRDDLDDFFIADISSLDTDASDKTEKRIINAFTEFSSNCNLYKRMKLSLDNFTFAKESIDVDLGIGKASFYNIIATEGYWKIGLYSTLIRCDSSRKAKVTVTLPKYIEITANIKIIGMKDLSYKLSSQSTKEGSISILLKNESISKEFFLQANNSNHEDDITRKISYWNTDVTLDIDAKYQKLIYKNLYEFLSEVESSLEQFLIDQLNAELSKNEISIDRSCSKFLNMGKNSKNINSPFLNKDISDFNNVYVIQNIPIESWKGISQSSGSIIIKGISHFNSIEVDISATDLSSPSDDGFFYSFPDYQEKKEMTLRFVTNGLRGKLNWSYNSKQTSFSFFIDFIQFEIKKKKIYKYKNIFASDDRYNIIMCVRNEENMMNVDVYLGDVRFKSSGDCEKQNEFMNFILSEYLKSIVKDSLKNSLEKKLQNNYFGKYC
ncbi:uncharacterized protein LOC135840956 [Planococcus citri]|uniref:uncharacterized protein LOC135840956 n=1 Tax=Planococcus citri TaxID=170843 RepID=UPI0031F820F5